MRFISAVIYLLVLTPICFSAQAPPDNHYDPDKALVLDEYTPVPQIVARADSLQSLMAATKCPRQNKLTDFILSG
jgi:hypothetical protein